MDRKSGDIDNRNYPTSERRREIDKKKIKVTRHFMGDRDLSTLMFGIALQQANRDFNL